MSQGGNLKAFVLGGTGATGKEIVKSLAQSSQFSKVTLIGRRQVKLPTSDEDKSYDKFDEKIIDFDRLDEYADTFKGYDVGFSSLGTTRGKSGADGFYKVDHDYVINTAKLAKSGGTKDFHLVSSGGADPNSFFLYTKTKGEAEEEVKAMGFSRLSIYRPGVLLTDSREDRRIPEAVLRSLLKPLDVARWFSVDVPLLGKVIVANSLRESKDAVELVMNKDIIAMGKSL